MKSHKNIKCDCFNLQCLTALLVLVQSYIFQIGKIFDGEKGNITKAIWDRSGEVATEFILRIMDLGNVNMDGIDTWTEKVFAALENLNTNPSVR